MTISSVGRFPLNEVTEGDCGKLIADLPDNCLDVVVTSPPYWGQRMSEGNGVEPDPRVYLAGLAAPVQLAAAEAEARRPALAQRRRRV